MYLICMKFLYALVLSAVSAAPLSKTVGADDEYHAHVQYNHNCARGDMDSETALCPYPYPYSSQAEYDASLSKRNIVVSGQYNHNCNRLDVDSDTGRCPYPFPYKSQAEYDASQ